MNENHEFSQILDDASQASSAELPAVIDAPQPSAAELPVVVEAPQAPYGAPQAPYGAPQAPYGAPQAPYGAPQAPYGAPQAPYGAPQAPYGAPQAPYGAYQAPGYSAPQPPVEDLDGLCAALLYAVRGQLKAPMTAVLCPKEQLVIRQNGGAYEVEGLVHSQNSYGAMIATDFSATVARSNGFWSVLRTSVGVKSAKNYAKNFAINYIAISIFVGVMALIGTGILFAIFGL